MPEYSEKTQQLLDRMCRVAERKEYVFDKDKITELVNKSYQLFNLPVPNIIWCIDITNKDFLESAWSVWSASSARSAWSAWSAWSASSARSASSATDCDGQEFIFCFEFAQANPDKINQHDKLFLESQELFLQLKEAGAGYWAEKDGILYICPNAIVYQDEQQRFHSETKPAIAWKDGLECYFLDGISLDKTIWQKVTNQTASFAEIMQIENADAQAVALKYCSNSLLQLPAKLLDKSFMGDELYLLKNHELNDFTQEKEIYFLKMKCPTGRTFVEFVEPEFARQSKSALACQAKAWDLTAEEYKRVRVHG